MEPVKGNDIHEVCHIRCACPTVCCSVTINMDKVITVLFFLLQVRVVVTHCTCQLAGKFETERRKLRNV